VLSLSRTFGRNWTLKGSAIGIALLLWIAVRVDAPNRHELTSVPVRVDLQDPGWALLDAPAPSTVVVRLSGPSGELIRIVGERPPSVMPLDEVASPDTTVVLRNQWVRVQERGGVVVEGIQPSTVRLTLEPVERLTLPAAPRLEGSLPERLALARPPVPNPADIRVIGPRSRVQRLDSVPLLPVDLSAVSGSGSVTVGVDTSRARGVHVQPALVRVELRVEDRVERVVSGIPVVLPDGLDMDELDVEVRPRTVAVILRGARSVVEAADPRELRLMVDVDGDGIPERGEEASFPLRLVGLPELLGGAIQQNEVVLRRLEEDP
jgi:YbbR domain-containing protein